MRKQLSLSCYCVILLLAASACAGSSNVEGGPEISSETTTTIDPAEEMRGGLPSTSSRASRILSPIVDDFETPWPGETVLRFPTDVGDLDLGDPRTPCTPFQRLEEGEFGETMTSSRAWSLDQNPAIVGVRVHWFETISDAEAYRAAYDEVCDSYETFNGSGDGSARGIERILEFETVRFDRDPTSDVGVLSSEWFATLNDRGWGNDIVHAQQIDTFVIETKMRFGGPVSSRRVEADELFEAFIAQFVSVYES